MIYDNPIYVYKFKNKEQGKDIELYLIISDPFAWCSTSPSLSTRGSW
jgi:hypothetical protein